MKANRSNGDVGFEVFEYEQRWHQEFLSKRVVEEWCRLCPDQFTREPPKRKPGTALYFAQNALMFLLWRDYGIRSLTWLRVAAVDRRALLQDGDWSDTVPSRSKSHDQTLAHWNTMREVMGRSRFAALQKNIVESNFRRHKGEPDLFCYTRQGNWFFAEAKTEEDALLRSQLNWFSISERVIGPAGQVFLCRLVARGSPDGPSRGRHTARWATVVGPARIS